MSFRAGAGTGSRSLELLVAYVDLPRHLLIYRGGFSRDLLVLFVLHFLRVLLGKGLEISSRPALASEILWTLCQDTWAFEKLRVEPGAQSLPPPPSHTGRPVQHISDLESGDGVLVV